LRDATDEERLTCRNFARKMIFAYVDYVNAQK
jgi:hypothetical protein